MWSKAQDTLFYITNLAGVLLEVWAKSQTELPELDLLYCTIDDAGAPEGIYKLTLLYDIVRYFRYGTIRVPGELLRHLFGGKSRTTSFTRARH